MADEGERGQKISEKNGRRMTTALCHVHVLIWIVAWNPFLTDSVRSKKPISVLYLSIQSKGKLKRQPYETTLWEL